MSNVETTKVIDEADRNSQSEILDLINRCSRGDQKAVQEFFDLYSQDIYNFPIKVFHLDEDAASDFFLYAFERFKERNRFKSFEGRSSFRTWLYTVLRNLVIDWMRTIREVEIVHTYRKDEHGNEYQHIENTPDPRNGDPFQEDAMQELERGLDSLPLDLRLVFKLSYIYYLELDEVELKELIVRYGKSESELIRYLVELKHHLSLRELKNIDSEDKITSLYMSILNLKRKRSKLVNESKNIHSFSSSTNEYEIAQLNHAIEKKYRQREKLLEKKEKGHFVVRTPYRYVSELLGVPEGNISVQMMRVIEKLKAKTDFFS